MASDSRNGRIDRRGFLTLAGGAASALLVGCGDDAIGSGTDGDTDSDGSSSSSGRTVGTGSSSTSSTTAEATSSTGPDGTGTSTDESSSGPDESSSSSTGGEPSCENPQILQFDPELVSEDNGMFPLAVLAGEMKPTSALLAIYISDGGSKLLRIWQPAEEPNAIALVYEAMVEPGTDGYTKIPIEGLCAGEWYQYAYFSGDANDPDARSAIGEFRTALPEDSMEPLVLAVSSCNGDSLNWPALDLMADEYYDAFIHLGDMAYNDGMFSLAEFRNSWTDYMSAPDYRKAFARAGLYVTWDDHEIDDNSNFDRETMDPQQLEKRQNAMDAFFELLPIEGEGPDYQVWRSFRWGLTAEIFVLDCRYERRPSQGLYMSPQQMAWLKDRLAESPCHFKIIMNSVPITNMPTQWDIAANDRWDGYPGQRNELMTWINANQIENIWFLGGDFHVCFVSRLEPNSTNLFGNIREIAVTGGNVNPVPDFLLGLDGSQFDYGVTAPRGLVMTFDPVADEVNVRFIDPETGDDDYNETLSWSP